MKAKIQYRGKEYNYMPKELLVQLVEMNIIEITHKGVQKTKVPGSLTRKIRNCLKAEHKKKRQQMMREWKFK